MPRSLTVLRVCAVAAWDERPAARARVKTRDARFMAKPFRIVRDRLLSSRTSMGNLVVHCRKCLLDRQTPLNRSTMDQRSRATPLNVQRLKQLAHHRTVGGPGKGVDGDLLSPVINNGARIRRPAPGFKRCSGGGGHMNSSNDSHSPKDAKRSISHKAETTLVTAGRDATAHKGFVNPPVVRGSTVLYPTADDLHAHRGEFQYGRHGTPTTKALQEALMALEGPQCAGVGIAPSGLSAISTALLAVLKAGDHLLVCDNAYRPSRNFCNGLLSRYGVETTYFDPLIGAGIAGLFKPNTKAVLVEAPGSQSFEMPDIPAIAAVAPGRGYQRRSGCLACAQVPTTCFWRCAACARLRCGWRSTIDPRSRSRAGLRPGRRFSGCCTRLSKATRAMRSGNGILPERGACSVSF